MRRLYTEDMLTMLTLSVCIMSESTLMRLHLLRPLSIRSMYSLPEFITLSGLWHRGSIIWNISMTVLVMTCMLAFQTLESSLTFIIIVGTFLTIGCGCQLRLILKMLFILLVNLREKSLVLSLVRLLNVKVVIILGIREKVHSMIVVIGLPFLVPLPLVLLEVV